MDKLATRVLELLDYSDPGPLRSSWRHLRSCFWIIISATLAAGLTVSMSSTFVSNMVLSFLAFAEDGCSLGGRVGPCYNCAFCRRFASRLRGGGRPHGERQVQRVVRPLGEVEGPALINWILVDVESPADGEDTTA